MTMDYDQKYGPNGKYPWPSSAEVAERFIDAALYAKTSHQCLDDDFFFDYLDQLDDYLFFDYPEDEALEMIKANAKSRQQLFKEARKWSLEDLVASATYKICSTKSEEYEGAHMICRLWDCFFWPFLVFDELLFDMFQAKEWDKMHRDQLRQSFRSLLVTEVYGGVTINKLLWSSDIDNGKEKLWFTYPGFARNVYPENVLRCLNLIGIDPERAHLAVEKVFKVKSLAPLYDVLSDDPSPMSATILNCSDRGEGEETETPSLINVIDDDIIGTNDQKPSINVIDDETDPRIIARTPISLALLFAGVFLAIALPRLRSSRSKLDSTPLVQITQIAQTDSPPCFAAMRMGWLKIPGTGRKNATVEEEKLRVSFHRGNQERRHPQSKLDK